MKSAGGKPVDVKPALGGKLMSGLSMDSAGIQNYIAKQEMRRVLEREVRAEGYEWFRPNPLNDKLVESIPPGSTNPITVIAACRLGNGQISAVVGSGTALWRYWGLESPTYFDSENNSTYFDSEYFLQNNIIPAGASYPNSDPLHRYTISVVPGQTYQLTFGHQEVQVQDGTTGTNYNKQALGGDGAQIYITPVFNTLVFFGTLNHPVTATLVQPSTYYDDAAYSWKQIGSGLSAACNRWEFVQVGDYLVLNNGVDLPVTYNLLDQAVKPIYELREQGIASVGTVASHDGNLLCGDIWQINNDAFLALMAAIPAARFADQDNTGKVSVIAAELFPRLTSISLVGLTLFWASGEARQILSVDGSGNIYVNNDVPVPSGPLSVENPIAYAAFTDQTQMQRFPWRFFPSMPNNPRRFGAVVPISSKFNSDTLTFAYPVRSFSELFIKAAATAPYPSGLPSVTVNGIAINAGNLTSNVLWINPGIANSIVLFDNAQYPQVSTVDKPVYMEAADSAASYAGAFQDLQDDGAAIVKMLQLQTNIIVYKEPSKDSAIFIGTFTGDLNTPYQFEKVPINLESAALHFRNCIVATGGGFYGSNHIYAGEDAFYKFDLFIRTPQQIPVLQPCQDIFFDNAQDPENAWAVENPLTKEIFFCFGINPNITDTALCYDTIYNTARTTTVGFTAAAKVNNPSPNNGKELFVFGMPDGSLQRYGLYDAPVLVSSTTVSITGGVATSLAAFFLPNHVGMTIVCADGTKAAILEYVSPTSVQVLTVAGITTTAQTFRLIPEIYHRCGVAYTSAQESGVYDFNFSTGEKILNEYSLSLSSKWPMSADPVTVTFKGGSNAADISDIQSAIILSPNTMNFLRPSLIQFYIGTRLTITGINNPMEFVAQSFNVQPVSSHGFANLQFSKR